MYPPPSGPGYQGYPPPPPPRLRPVRGLAVFAIAALVCDSAIGLIAAGIDLWYAGLVDRIAADVTAVPESEINTGDLVYGLSGILEFAVYVLVIVAFLVWLFRVRANAEILSPGGHRRGKPWVFFGWLVPIIAFWFPKQIVDDIWYASARAGHAAAPPSKGLIDAWWAAWLVASLVSNLAGRILFSADDLDTIAAAARFDVVSIALLVVAAVLAIGVIRKITDAQEQQRNPDLTPGVPTGYPAY
ncbi:DUF4328 domain-containing protein [Nonomuraea insulae]|uniref:DUF4328 domain-containing protein n=1 Tax=Nonomuraea insulae TaxID=1616787 RepID=A0ABW1CX07_9ACTN